MKLFATALVVLALAGWVLVGGPMPNKQKNLLDSLLEGLPNGQALVSKLQPIELHPSRARLLTDYNNKQLEMSNTVFEGTWTSPATIAPFGFFDSRQGEVHEYFHFNHTLQPDTYSHVNTLGLVMFDPEYRDRKMAWLIVPMLNNFNAPAGQWEGTNVSSYLLLFDNTEMLSAQENIPVNFTANETYIQASSEGLFQLAITQHGPVYHGAAPWVLLVPSLLMFLAIHFTIKANIPAMKISILSLLFTLNFLLFVALLQLYNGVANIDNREGWMLLTGAITFGCSMRFTQSFEETIRRITGIQGYIWFYFVSFLYLWCLFNYSLRTWFQLVNSLVLLPQIIHSAWRGVKPVTNLSYISVLLINQLYVLYYRGVPHNAMRISPNYMVCAGVCWILAAQLIFIILQNRYGSRFFILKRCIPNYHEYYMEVDMTELNVKLLGEDCPICLFPLGEEPGSVLDPETRNTSLKELKKRIMRTPCNHMFHIVCLEGWMEHKFECPIDRSTLPPLE